MREHSARYILIGILLLLITLVFFVLRGLVTTILSSFVVAYLFFPVYKWLRNKTKRENISSLITIFIIILLFSAPVIFMYRSINQEARSTYVEIKQVLATKTLYEGECESGPFCALIRGVESQLKDAEVNAVLTNLLTKVNAFLIGTSTDFLFAVPVFLLHFFIMIFIVFYMLKEGETITYRMRRLMPLRKVHRENIFNQLSEVTYAVVYGQIVVAAIQAIIGILAFALFDVNAPIMWGFLMFFFALIPFLGTPIVWVPAVIVKLAQAEPGNALGVLIAGLFISTIDNIIRPRIVSSRARVHPVVVLLGVIGGLTVFGPIGLILGPVALSIFITFIKIYEEDIEAES